MGSEGISVADALALSNTRGTTNGNGGMFGDGNGAWWVIILILFFAVGGWGRGGNNSNGNGGSCSGATVAIPYAMPFGGYGSSGLTDAFNFNQLDNGIRGLSNGLCDGFYAMNNSINALGMALQNCCCETQTGMLQGFNTVGQAIANLGYQTQQGFCGIDKSIMTSDFHNQSGFNSIANQMATCCCDIQRGQDAAKYDLAQSLNQLLVAGDKNTDRIINFLTQTELQNLRTQNEEYRSQLQIQTQNRTLIDALLPVAKPAYITCSPYASAFGMYPYSGYNTGCGCGCA